MRSSGLSDSSDSFPSSQEALVIPLCGGFAWERSLGSSGFLSLHWKLELPGRGSQPGGWEPDPVLGQPGWREWLAGTACLIGGAWLLSLGLFGALPGCALLLAGLHHFCRRDELLMAADHRRYYRRRGYPGYYRVWPVVVADLALTVHERMNDFDEPFYELALDVADQPAARLPLGWYANRDSALAAAGRLGIPCLSSSTETWT